MRPYLTLIKDSFRAALASRVLYVLLFVITLLLLALAPLHVVEVLDWKVVFGKNVTRPARLAEQLVERGENPKYPATMRVWEMLDDGLKEDVQTWVASMADDAEEPEGVDVLKHMSTRDRLEDGLNEIIKDRSFYVEEAWAQMKLNKEANKYIEDGVDNLSEQQSRRLNRLLMARATGRKIKLGEDRAQELKYAIWGWDLTFTMSESMFAQTVTGIVTQVFDWIIWIGLFIAILVTANIIPETFLPGSLNLLLSKPISRWGLLIAKFVGGCAYVSLCGIYLFVGLWIWLGLAMGIWDPRILWAIPLYIVVFAIYYSVSTLVGVWSRSQILAIVMTMLFWAFCFGVGVTHNVIRNSLSNSKTRDLIAVEDNLLQLKDQGGLGVISKWNDSKSTWDNALTAKMMGPQGAMIDILSAFGDTDEQGDDGAPPKLGPIIDPRSGQIIASMPDLTNIASMEYQDLFASHPDNINFRSIGKMPRDVFTLLPAKEGLIAVDSAGRWQRLDDLSPPSKDDSADSSDEKSETKTEKKGGLLPGLMKKQKTKKEPFTNISPKKISVVSRKHSIAVNKVTSSIVVHDDSILKRYVLNDEGKYEFALEKDIADLLSLGVHVQVAAGGDLVLAALGNGQILSFDEETLEHKQTYRPQKESRYRTIRTSSDGRYFVIACYNRTAWLLDGTSPESISQLGMVSQGDVTAISFDEEDHLWVGNQMNVARQYDMETGKQISSESPKTGFLAKAYSYALRPFYLFCPKPGEFYRVVEHAAGSNDSEGENDETLEVNLSRSSRYRDPWQPLWSGLLFMAFTLGIACFIFHRRDF